MCVCVCILYVNIGVYIDSICISIYHKSVPNKKAQKCHVSPWFLALPMDFHIRTLILFIKTTIQVAIGGDLIDGHLHKRAGWNMAEEKQEETMLMEC